MAIEFGNQTLNSHVTVGKIHATPHTGPVIVQTTRIHDNEGKQDLNKTDKVESNSTDALYNSKYTYVRQNHLNHWLPKPLDCPPESLQIIGAGLMRTGTTSLKHALQYLYQKPCYHMSDVVGHFGQMHIQSWIEIFKKTDSNLEQIPWEFWHRIFRGYAASVDYPTCAFYKELLLMYPNAKIILTLRDPDDWVASVRATMGSEAMRRNATFGQRLVYSMRGVKNLPELHHFMFSRTLGKYFSTMTDIELKQAFIEWNKQVKLTVPSDRLLIFEPSQGWSPLCQFLNLPLPPNGMAYPHLSTREEMVKVINGYLIPGRILDFISKIIILLSCFLISICFYSWCQG